MTDSDRKSLGSSLAIVTTIVAIIILGFTLTSISLGPTAYSTATLAGFSACLATILGFWSLYVISQEGLLREDPYHIMTLSLSIGLLLFAMVDVARTGAILNPTSEIYSYTISSTMIAILVILVIGIVGYARSVNSVLNYMKQNERILLMVISLASAFVGLSFVGVAGEQTITRTFRMLITTGGFASLCITLAYVVNVLRDGSLSKQLAHIFIGLVLIFVQTLLAWWATDLTANTISSVLGAEAYLLISLGIHRGCEECVFLEAGVDIE
ncbi:MAG: membrane protein of unknown function [Candidatus Thorarchaeota archaeon]|nr:MAG: membrane protein of unknown function [Candidatus Thorarchaeota archaeon]